MLTVVLRLARRTLAVAMVVAVLFLLLENRWRAGCYTDVFEKPEVAGYSFEISETDCWHSPHVSVFIISWLGLRTRLFQYTRYESRDGPSPHPLPVITKIDEHTIQISLERVGRIDCRLEKWGELKIKYGIGLARYHSLDDPVSECSQ